MGLLAFFVLIVVPALEIFVFVQVAHLVGLGWALLLVLAFSLLGISVMRRAGSSWWRALRGPATAGGVTVVNRPDGTGAARAALLFLAGLLLFLPGFITDVLGLVLLLPPVRALLQTATAAWFVRRFTAVDGPGGMRIWTRRTGVVRGDVVREDGSARADRRPPGQLPG
jgi:UPF0716 protein FxsA